MSAVNKSGSCNIIDLLQYLQARNPGDFLCGTTGTGDRTYENIVVLHSLQYCTNTALPCHIISWFVVRTLVRIHSED
ncbi:hypothetical protein QUB63_20790 [Microcoleus sp. ARI1-B5]|uniref:hypothetical protein n=1 Tax=unclassified Microcoleus TaxID=2642155 RepID=UPI002FD0CAA3